MATSMVAVRVNMATIRLSRGTIRITSSSSSSQVTEAHPNKKPRTLTTAAIRINSSTQASKLTAKSSMGNSSMGNSSTIKVRQPTLNNNRTEDSILRKKGVILLKANTSIKVSIHRLVQQGSSTHRDQWQGLECTLRKRVIVD